MKSTLRQAMKETQFNKGIVKDYTHLRKKPRKDAFNPTKES